MLLEGGDAIDAEGCTYALLEGAIDVLAMTDLDDIYDEFVVFDSVHDSILALADSIAVMTRKLLASRGAGFVAGLLDPFYNALAIKLMSGSMARSSKAATCAQSQERCNQEYCSTMS